MFRLPIELQALVDIYDQPFLVIDDAHRVGVVNRASQNAFLAEGGTTAGIACHQSMSAHQGPRPCGSGDACPCAETFTHQVQRTSAFTCRDTDGREHLVRTQACPLRTHSGQTFVGVLMHQETLRDRPTAEDGAGPRSSMVGRFPAFREMLDRLLKAANTHAHCLNDVRLQGPNPRAVAQALGELGRTAVERLPSASLVDELWGLLHQRIQAHLIPNYLDRLKS
jgi:hypothetical protein